MSDNKNSGSYDVCCIVGWYEGMLRALVEQAKLYRSTYYDYSEFCSRLQMANADR